MTIQEFNLLTFDQKVNVICKHGIYVAGRNEGETAFNLYSVFSFYTELLFNFEHDSLDKIIVFDNASSLEPYIEEIHLNI